MNNKNIQLRILEGPSKLDIVESFLHAGDNSLERLKAMSVVFTVVNTEGNQKLEYLTGLVMSMEHCSDRRDTYKLKIASYPDLEHMVIVTCYYSAQYRNGYAFISEANYSLVSQTLAIGSLNESSIIWTNRKTESDLKTLADLKDMTKHFAKTTAKRIHHIFKMEAARVKAEIEKRQNA